MCSGSGMLLDDICPLCDGDLHGEDEVETKEDSPVFIKKTLERWQWTDNLPRKLVAHFPSAFMHEIP